MSGLTLLAEQNKFVLNAFKSTRPQDVSNPFVKLRSIGALRHRELMSDNDRNIIIGAKGGAKEERKDSTLMSSSGDDRWNNKSVPVELKKIVDKRSEPLRVKSSFDGALPTGAAINRMVRSQVAAVVRVPKSSPTLDNTEQPCTASRTLNFATVSEKDEKLGGHQGISKLSPCPSCGRRFAPDRLDRHVSACAKQQEEHLQQKSKRIDLRAKRIAHCYAENNATEAEARAIVEQLEHVNTKRVDNAKSNVSTWRKQSAQLQASLRGEGTVQQDLVPCSGCGRKFAPDTAQRHIPNCVARSSHAPKPVVRR